eukprot:6314559-Amphidinium_carterae.1
MFVLLLVLTSSGHTLQHRWWGRNLICNTSSGSRLWTEKFSLWKLLTVTPIHIRARFKSCLSSRDMLEVNFDITCISRRAAATEAVKKLTQDGLLASAILNPYTA